MLKFILNGTEVVNQPIGAEDLEERLYYSNALKGYLLELTGKVTFYGTDFDSIRSIYEDNYCDELTIEIQLLDNNGHFIENVFKGLIKMADIEFDLIKETVSCEIIDDGFIARIDNNKKIKFNIGVPRSKNDIDITSYTTTYNHFNFFSPQTGRYHNDEYSGPPDLRPANKTGVWLYDAFKFLIAAMSDGEIDFESNYFSYDLITPSNSRTEAWTAIFSGKEIRSASGDFPYISFEELYTDVQKAFNVFFQITRQANGRPLLRIEEYDYFRGVDSGYVFQNLTELTESIYEDRLYAKITFGCSTNPADKPLPNIPFAYQNQEEYAASGQCNRDTTLELRMSTLVINTNTIADALQSVTGFSVGSQKFKGETSDIGGVNQLYDSGANFIDADIQGGDILFNVITGKYTYIEVVNSATLLTLADDIMNVGSYNNYIIYSPNESDTYKDKVFMVHFTEPPTLNNFTAQKDSQTIGSTTYYIYNQILGNARVANRNLGIIPQSIVNYLGNGDDEMRAYMSAAVYTNNATYFGVNPLGNNSYKVVKYDNDSVLPGFDPNNNYNPATGYYTIPSAGAYFFVSQTTITRGTYAFGYYAAELVHTDSTGTILKTISSLSYDCNGTYSYWWGYLNNNTDNICQSFWHELTVSADAGDLVFLTIRKPYTASGGTTLTPVGTEGDFTADWGLYPSSNLWCRQVANGGGIYTGGQPDVVELYKYNFDEHLNLSDWNSIKSNYTGLYTIQYRPNKSKQGFIREIRRNINNGATNIEVAGSKTFSITDVNNG